MTAITPQAIAPEAPASTADLFLVAYSLIDDLYRELAPDAVRLRPGHDRVGLSDPEVLTLSVMREALSIDSETAFIRFMRRDHADLFPGLTERSRYHRRRKALTGVQQLLFARLAAELAEGAAWLVVDSAPVETTKVETTKVERSQTGAASVPEAAYHVRAARKLLFFGLRLHLVVTDAGATDAGAIAEFALAPADEPERDVAIGMLRGVAPAETGLVLGDANYTGAEFRRRAGRLGHEAWAGPKRSAPPPPGVSESDSKGWRRWVRSKRALVEAVFSMLADEFAVEVTRARSLLGVWTRVVAKVLAFDLGVYVNRLLGRPPLAIKPLFL